jgi:hypothetical protein
MNDRNQFQGKDPRIRLYAIAAFYVFDQCFRKAGIIENDTFQKELWVGRLTRRVLTELPESEKYWWEKGNYEHYIRDRFNQICNLINAGDPYKLIGFSLINFSPLLAFAGISDYEQLNPAFKNNPLQPPYFLVPVKGYNVAPAKLAAFSARLTLGNTPGGDDETTANDQPNENQKFHELENRLLSDEYNIDGEDVLGYDLHAYNLFHIMKDKQTNPPLNIGILAPWGRGKTSLMHKIENLFIKERIEALTGRKTAAKKTTIWDLKNWLHGKELFPANKIPHATVWFNPWNYQSSDMIWAGMANAIVEQVVEQLSNKIDRETFWFQLRLARINKEELRKEIQTRLTLYFLQFFLWGFTILFTGLLLYLKKEFALNFLGIASIVSMLSSAASRLKPEKNISEVFDKYSKPPQYLNKLGTYHEVQEDLKKVFDLLIDAEQPLVIFVDDLDRCSPLRVVEVIEAINVFISGEYRRMTYFVLGMDAEIVAASLDVAYDKMKGKIINRETEQGSLGWYFLDKFVQLPFFIPVLNEGKKVDYLRSLLKRNEVKEEQTESQLSDTEASEIAKQILTPDVGGEALNTVRNLSLEDERRVDKEILRQQIESTQDDEEILKEVAKYSIYINSDPRSLKRFANLLRFYNSYQVLRLKKGQKYAPINYLGKYIALMLKFPQLIRWIQWDTENKNGLSSSANIKAQLIDDAVAQLNSLSSIEEKYKSWSYTELPADPKDMLSEELKAVFEMQKEMPWLRSLSLVDILVSEIDINATIDYALDCNIW